MENTGHKREHHEHVFTRGATPPVALLIPKEFGGGAHIEILYEGYWVFDGKDAYALLAQWNKPDECIGDDDEDRGLGIDIGCYPDKHALLDYQLRFVTLAHFFETKCCYEDFDTFSVNCPRQGYFEEG